ncbi:endonuclease V [Aquimarina sediminis]|uniref:endonuclease V n=1 Tax=Aquimarina sediminis TaxID=2070536 RepID=UPI000CA0868F|nr:endonuclease V [Aquimarina sediminis]
MILAFDTYYYDNKAKTVCVSFENWNDSKPLDIDSEIIEGVEAYEPGSFYKRELPCILSLLKRMPITDIDYIIVDGFVLLDDEGKLGLGGHLFDAIDKSVPVLGVAKSGFHENKKNVRELLRGESIKPLYISAIGVELDRAYDMIKSMHGDFRMPTLLQILDTKTKEKVDESI